MFSKIDKYKSKTGGVFMLKKGMQFKLGGILYEVCHCRDNGKFVIKFKGVSS